MSTSTPDGMLAPATEENLKQILAGKVRPTRPRFPLIVAHAHAWPQYFFLATLTMLLYDHLLTLPDEVATVWKKKKTYVLCIFLFVRYYAPIAVAVVAVGTSPVFLLPPKRLALPPAYQRICIRAKATSPPP
ncbi:hypothetical protein EW146_g5633 [Bondarzewia mesenterica]|uniref:DUF6533 domain-containing protein n=1 Tax=Bondarzewia mesenterica TaxID=1095465 RepID=A0A4S4LQW5_9AGAM|nr:hypothetical protein EW146_g5633 [Bondarzewia mesenterica]